MIGERDFDLTYKAMYDCFTWKSIQIQESLASDKNSGYFI